MDQTTHQNRQVNSGLAGVIAAETTLSSVDGSKGELIIAGYPLTELANNATFEEVIHLLWHDRLPTPTELDALLARLAAWRTLPDATLRLLRTSAAQNVPVMDALRMGVGTLNLDTAEAQADTAVMLVARMPTLVAATWRMRQNKPIIEPDTTLGHAANYLYMLSGERPSAAQTRALETYLNTVVDHGLNASTFAARVIISTGSDLVSAVTGAIGALKGPLHGGAPGPALDMVFDIGEARHAEAYLRQKLEAGERLMGFGHRVYKVRDPRAEVLAAAAEKLYLVDGDLSLYELVKQVEKTAVALLEEYKPGRNLQTNVEFYTALLLHGLGLETTLFSPTFAIARIVGWIAHCQEQQTSGRIMRPRALYTGVKNRVWEAVELRK